MERSFVAIVLFVLTMGAVAPLLAQDEDPVWTATAGARYANRYSSYGIDLGNELSAFKYSAGLAHVNGASVGFGAVQTLGAGGSFETWSLSAGYDWEAAEWLSFAAEFCHSEYESDSANVLAALKNSVSVGMDIAIGSVTIGLSYDAYLGTNTASYISFDVSSYARLGQLSVVPMVQATMMSQTVEDRFLKKSSSGSSGSGGGSGGGSGSGGGGSSSTGKTITSTLTGLSSVSAHLVCVYPVIGGLRLSFHPQILYSPKSELASSEVQFLWSAGMKYSLEF